MAEQIDEVSHTLDENLAQNQKLMDQNNQLKSELEQRELREKQALTKILKMREERGRLRQ